MKSNIKNIKNRILSFATITVLITSLFVACSDETTPSLWEEKPKGDTPVISSIEPSLQGLAGVTEITINGNNFSEDKDKNFVYFTASKAAEKAEILECTKTKLVIKAPNLVNDAIKIKIAVHGVELFSNEYQYKLAAAVSELIVFKTFEQAYSLTTDKAGNLYYSFVSDGGGQGIKKFTTDGKVETFAPKGGETFYSGMKYGSDGAIYGVRNVRAVFRVVQGTAPATYVVLDNGVSLLDLDFDKNNNMWTGGSGGKIFSVTPAKVFKSFAFEPRVNSMKVYGDYLYVAGETATEHAVWRFKINSASDLGPAEKYFDFTTNFPIATYGIKSIFFSNDGDLFIGTTGTQTIIRVKPDKSFSNWYPGILYSPVVYATWGPGNVLYYVRGFIADKQTQTIIRVDMERPGAPYYGRD